MPRVGRSYAQYRENKLARKCLNVLLPPLVLTGLASCRQNYVDFPKKNGYRSLHTTVVHSTGLKMEFQV